jgi:hypothetical protein
VTAVVEPAAVWHTMECDLCPETWWLPYGPHPYGSVVIGLAYDHWRGHVRRGEDPRVEALKAGRVSDA